MRKDTALFIIGGFVVIILTGILVFGKNPKKDSNKITDIESCAKAGNPILQYNSQICKTADGKIFKE